MGCVEKVRRFSAVRGLFTPGSRVLAAVSGGPDSMALMTILSALSRRMGFELAAAHFDHRIRRGTEWELALVKSRARRLGLPCFLGAGDVPAESRRMKKGLEETARLLRLRFLEETARSWNASSIALGHTKDDQIETILHHVIRGAGWRGLRGISARRGLLIRPLLDCSRAELREYLKSARVRYAIDKSNFDTKLVRNRIRNRLLPYLKRNFSPSIGETLLRLSMNLSEGWEALEEPLLRLLPPSKAPDEVGIQLRTIAPLTDFQKYLLVDIVLRERFNIFQDIEKKHFDAVKGLIRSGKSGRRIELPHGVEALIEHSNFVLRRKSPDAQRRETLITGTGSYILRGWNLIVSLERVRPREIDPHTHEREACFGSVHFPVRVRARKPGDRIVPFGMKGQKKLSDIFIDRKVPLSRRNGIPIFEDARGIFWVPGVAADERTRITPGTRSAVRIKLSSRDE